MTLGELDEAVSVLAVMTDRLLATLSGQVGRQGAALRYAVGDLRAQAPDLLRTGTVALPILDCFTFAGLAGATLDGVDAVRAALVALAPTGLPGLAVGNLGIRFALGRMARILAATTFTSSQDVFAAIARMNAAFEQAEDYAANHRDPANFQALIALHAAVTRDLTTRAVSLPKLTAYRFARGMTAPTLANRLYGDAGRADELRAENKIIHPAFMPRRGTALSE